MSSTLEPTLVISMDVARSRPDTPGIPLPSVCEALIERLHQQQLPATLAVEDLAGAAWLDRFLRGVPQAEVAQLVPAEISAARVSREVFAQGFRLQREIGQQLGLELSSVVVETDDLPHGDLLARSGVRAIRTRCAQPSHEGLFAVRKRAVQSSGAQLVRYGLWHLPASVSFSSTSKGLGRWFGGSAGAAAERGIRQTIAQGGVFHLAIDAVALSDRDRWPALDQILGLAGRAYQHGSLNVLTNGSLISLLSDKTQSQPAGSILRRAA